MFPFDLDDDEDVLEEEQEETTSEQVDYEIDFTTGKLTGRIISGLDAVIQWIRLALGTEKYYFNQFSWDYGCELQSLIGRDYSEEIIDSEVDRMIRDTLSANEDIEGISDMDITYDNDKIQAVFTVNTVYGSEEVSIDV
jgi:predicted NUDIX family phosphoesterase